MTASYALTCPHCGGRLEPVAQGPECPPWLCRACRQGWWVAELTPEARDAYRHHRRDFRPHKPVRVAVFAERELAHQRGTSLREDQLGIVAPSTLAALGGRRITDDFAAAIAATGKGAP